jgi:heptaprenylglyceryl phosphate synthase
MAAVAESMDTDAIMVGGSTGVTQENLDATHPGHQEEGQGPGHLLPFRRPCHFAVTLTPCDFMSMLNSMVVENVICSR